MKVTYHYYEPDKGFEEIQAKIYNDELRRSPKSFSSEVTAEGIKQRFETENKDPKWVRYALKESQSPLAYIQVSVRAQPYIGYPWAMEDCPAEVQEKLFSEMLEHVRESHPSNEIVMGYLSNSWRRQIDFAEKEGFEIDDSVSIYYYTLDVDSIIKDTDHEFEVRKGNLEDLAALVELAKTDPNLENVFPDDEGWKNFFTNTLSGGHTFLVIKDELLICAGNVIEGNRSDGMQMQFFTTRPGFHKAWKILIKELALHSREEGWNKPLLFIALYKTELDQLTGDMEELGAKYFDKQVRLSLKK